MTATALKKEMDSVDTQHTEAWQKVCTKADLVAFSGVAAWLETAEGPAQVAIFYLPVGPDTPSLPDHSTELYALDHHDPFSSANVIARGIVGDLKGATVVASPVYKQHFRLADGQCLEDESVKLRTWKIEFKDDEVWIEG
ncbi:nitrite reductase small subunit NirD [Halomonas sp. SpR8]|uniref:nitrite reductase small subunit NirD n=1 Tax=Halomonas sp. SpR8 TaxID=3050463 RepID=UPI0027E44A56|nr:nitrite reductase small subunit NirD [Halomonas sp. SpR8]MDQ7727717.1 nitrite reductase small subunit NirD [Halomonas sp. SpR8]